MRDEHTPKSINKTYRSVCSTPVAPKPEDYLDELREDGDKTEARKLEVLAALFEIMKGFVDLGHGLTPVQNLIENFEKSAKQGMILVKCEDDQHEPI